MRTQLKVLNSEGKPIVLNSREQMNSDFLTTQIKNSLGYEIPIDTLTTIIKKVTEQKFYQIPFADYLPIKVGQGSWSAFLTTYRSYSMAGSFEDGIIDTGSGNSQLASADSGVDALNIKVFNWAKTNSWSIPDLQLAAKSGNWDIVSAKEKSRKENWDLGLQRIAFLGANGQNGVGGSCLGLLTQPGVTVNTTRITKAISSMSTSELKTFCAGVVEDYRSNCYRTAWPDIFSIPESDYNGLAAQASPDFPIKSTLQLLEEMFKVICQKPGFKILPLSYADAAYHSDVSQIAGKQVYTLLRYDEESVRMDIPVDYTSTLANSVNNFQFQNVGYGQLTGVLAYRPLEMLYFQY